jgi:hypothetical protein
MSCGDGTALARAVSTEQNSCVSPYGNIVPCARCLRDALMSMPSVPTAAACVGPGAVWTLRTMITIAATKIEPTTALALNQRPNALGSFVHIWTKARYSPLVIIDPPLAGGGTAPKIPSRRAARTSLSRYPRRCARCARSYGRSGATVRTGGQNGCQPRQGDGLRSHGDADSVVAVAVIRRAPPGTMSISPATAHAIAVVRACVRVYRGAGPRLEPHPLGGIVMQQQDCMRIAPARSSDRSLRARSCRPSKGGDWK